MKEERFLELLEQTLDKRFDEYDKKMDNRFESYDKKLERMFEENNKKLIALINDSAETILAITNKKIDDLDKKIDENYEKLEQKIIDNNFYLERTYGDKIDAMFEKIMMMDKMKYDDHKEIKNLDKRIDYNHTVLGSHDIRITKLEKEAASS